MIDANQGTGLWNEFGKSGGIHEPGAAERRAATRRRRRPGILAATAVAAAVAAVAGAGFWLSTGHGTRHATPTGTAAGTAAQATAASAERPARSTEPSTAAPALMVTADQAFPAHVAGYTEVKQSGGPNCTDSGMVGPNLTALIDRSKGCRGVVGALYKDAANNEYTIAVFGMKDPADAVHLVTTLGSHPVDYEVGVLLPPAGSGLKSLPADSGLVQSFAGTGRLAVVGLAQWSDGRTADYQALVDKLQPLIGAVTRTAGAHDR